MSLTTEDLIKIGEIVEFKINEALIPIREEMKTFVKRDEFNELKDIVIGIRNELDTEHSFRYQKIIENSDRIEKIEQKIHT